jgi:hypothetical protein
MSLNFRSSTSAVMVQQFNTLNNEFDTVFFKNYNFFFGNLGFVLDLDKKNICLRVI